jgi:hypothetical protein
MVDSPTRSTVEGASRNPKIDGLGDAKCSKALMLLLALMNSNV